MSAPHILVVDDEPDIRQLVKEILEDEGYLVSVAENGEEAKKARRTRRPDLILLDVWMPDIDGISLLREWSEEDEIGPPVIMISGHGTVETAVEATRLGAYDFVEKPLSLAKLLLIVKRALEAYKLQRENIGLRQHAQPLVEPVGRSITVQNLNDQVRRIAQHNAWVLLSGEPGCGKELYAHYIHACSARSEGPFVNVGVASIAGENSAVELFGSEDGEKIRYGRIEQANGGTLFLDEVGDMDSAVQAKLLSTLETGSFLRVGGSDPVQFDVRVIAATHRDLEVDVKSGRFREDLYYQLNVLPLRILPLREHNEDIAELLEYYVDFYATQENLAYRTFSTAAINRLRNYPWPGNVRELKNLVQRLLILGSGEEINLDEAEFALGMKGQQEAPKSSLGVDMPLREARKQFEKAYFEYQLREANGNMGEVARQAGIERTHLYRKLKEYGIKQKQDPHGE
ncbi:MAG: sigma-54-dependent transcriptional regulator [Gammaproteobacteria bacterium]